MNEIEKMYENAGIERERKDAIILDAKTLEPKYNNVCYGYPPFTAEKQIRIMAFLINRKVGLSFKAEQGEITVETISRGLAGIVNTIWQDLTEEEKQQIKQILE